jgi:hypothetical protein
MSMADIRKQYGVPAKRGGLVEHDFEGITIKGTIIGVARGGGRLRVRRSLDGYVMEIHPTNNIRYLDEK